MIYKIIKTIFNYFNLYFNKRILMIQISLKINKLYLDLNLILHQLRLNCLDVIKVFSFKEFQNFKYFTKKRIKNINLNTRYNYLIVDMN